MMALGRLSLSPLQAPQSEASEAQPRWPGESGVSVSQRCAVRRAVQPAHRQAFLELTHHVAQR
jgi:hypothetical protein